ncbi:acyltransferase family protein [Halioxenophilus sp. WMMB6]|uniref:acyltransferase family protein n=1 Tax=Halioxenophilus sp. WMMB6 TaxID=3073815 RepID=UPI00295EC902|nr:acyltransferase family protein [Halioxenophilus sp. WMMB6]
MQGSRPPYRPDIDALRGISILAVTLFHAFPRFMPGGFIGVDTFFVISGYLISQRLVADIRSDHFSYLAFLWRRAKRLLPALFLMLAVATAIAPRLMITVELQSFYKHLLGALTYTSNFILLSESGYFDASASSKPLLHLWSLAVEEQFYLLWPFLLLFAHRAKLLMPSMWAVTITSLLAAVWLTTINEAAAFYLPFTRFWELGAGGLLALAQQPNGLLGDKFHLRIGPWAGLALIIPCCFLLNGEMAYPGYIATVPVLAALLILAGTSSSGEHGGKFKLEPLVKLGLLSYSLYLWHWPILTVHHWLMLGNDNLQTITTALFIALFAAIATYRFVERPILHKKSFQPLAVKIPVRAVAMVLFATLPFQFLLPNATQAKADRYAMIENKRQLQRQNIKSESCIKQFSNDAYFCRFYGDIDNVQVAVVGDSTANALAGGLGQILAERYQVGTFNVGRPTCPPFTELSESRGWFSNPPGVCKGLVDRYVEYIINDNKITTVVLVNLAKSLSVVEFAEESSPLNPEAQAKLASQALKNMTARLQRAGKHVIAVVDMPYFPITAAECIHRLAVTGDAAQCLFEEKSMIGADYAILLSLALDQPPNSCVYSHKKLFQHRGKYSMLSPEGILLVRDSSHLSYYGAKLAAELIIEQCAIKTS